MHTAKLLKRGRSQVVRLPEGCMLPGDEVYLKKVGGVVVLIPKGESPWKPLVDSLDKFSEDCFDFKRDQGRFSRAKTRKSSRE